jgi:ABC-type multidrug transport system permease subunit
MIRAVWGMARNDLAAWRRSPAAIAGALLPAIGMGVLVAALTVSVGQQPVALVTQGTGPYAQRMAGILRHDVDAYDLLDMTAQEAERAIASQRVAAIIVVPEHFDEHVGTSDAAVDLHLNNVDIDLSDDLRRSVTRSVAQFDAPQLSPEGELRDIIAGMMLPNPYRVSVAEHDLRKTNVSFLQYQVIPIIVLIVISVGMLGTALLTARDFERRTAKVLVLSPAPRSALVLGRLLGGVLLTLMLVVPLVVAGYLTHYDEFVMVRCVVGARMWLMLLLSAPCGWVLPPVSWTHGVALVGLLIAVTAMTVGLGTLLGVALRDVSLVTMSGLNVAAFLFFLGGGFTTVAFLPRWLQVASRFVPTSYAIEGLRQALFYPDLTGVGRDLLVLTGCAIASVVLACLGLSRAWRRV